jgi:predicted nucleic-acid-binding Zn-ribbon protein
MKDLIRNILREEIKINESNKLSNDTFIEKAKKIHGEKYVYDKIKYTNAHNKVLITCPIHGDFEQRAYVHLQGFNCPKCGKENAAKKTRLGIKSFMEKAFDIHGNKYDYSKVDYKKNNTPVTIICPEHGEFRQSPLSHIQQKANCPKCSGRYADTDTFIEKAKKIHGEKYDYSLVNYINNKKPVTIICPIHGNFEQVPNYHLEGNGCQKCGGNVTLTTNEFISKSNEIHNNKYDYDLVVYKNSNTPVTIICPKHGEFQQRPGKHLKGAGCNKCAIESSRYTTNDFIKKSQEKHGDRYDYSKSVYTGSRDPITIICKKHGEFTQDAIQHMRGSNCPRCLESKGETFVGKILQSLNIIFDRQKKFEDCKGLNKVRCRRLPFDFYLPQYNTMIEYDGKQHFEPVDLYGGEEGFNRVQTYDKIKNKYCSDNGIKMIRIPYFMKLDDIQPFIKKELGITS